MNAKTRKLISAMLAVCMLVSLLPAGMISASAEDAPVTYDFKEVAIAYFAANEGVTDLDFSTVATEFSFTEGYNTVTAPWKFVSKTEGALFQAQENTVNKNGLILMSSKDKEESVTVAIKVPAKANYTFSVDLTSFAAGNDGSRPFDLYLAHENVPTENRTDAAYKLNEKTILPTVTYTDAENSDIDNAAYNDQVVSFENIPLNAGVYYVTFVAPISGAVEGAVSDKGRYVYLDSIDLVRSGSYSNPTSPNRIVVNKAYSGNMIAPDPETKVPHPERGTLQLSTYILPLTADQSVTYSSTDKSVVTVDEHGLVTAVGDGLAGILVTRSSEYKEMISIAVGEDTHVYAINEVAKKFMLENDLYNADLHQTPKMNAMFGDPENEWWKTLPYGSVSDPWFYDSSNGLSNLNLYYGGSGETGTGTSPTNSKHGLFIELNNNPIGYARFRFRVRESGYYKVEFLHMMSNSKDTLSNNNTGTDAADIYIAPVNVPESTMMHKNYKVMTTSDFVTDWAQPHEDVSSSVYLPAGDYMVTIDTLEVGRYLYLHHFGLVKDTDAPSEAPAVKSVGFTGLPDDILVDGSTVTLAASTFPITDSDETITWSTSNEAIVSLKPSETDSHVAEITALGTGVVEITAKTASGVESTVTVTAGKNTYEYRFAEFAGTYHAEKNMGTQELLHFDQTPFTSYAWAADYALITDPWRYVTKSGNSSFFFNKYEDQYGVFTLGYTTTDNVQPTLTIAINLVEGEYTATMKQLVTVATVGSGSGPEGFTRPVEFYLCPVDGSGVVPDLNELTAEEYKFLSTEPLYENRSDFQHDTSEPFHVPETGEYYLTFSGIGVGRYMYANKLTFSRKSSDNFASPKAVSFDTQNTVLAIGQSAKLNATVSPFNANQEVKYTSSDPTLATVDAVTGEVTAKAPGIVSIIATSAVDSSISAKTLIIIPELTLTNAAYLYDFDAVGKAYGEKNSVTDVNLAAASFTDYNWCTEDYAALTSPFKYVAEESNNSYMHVFTKDHKNNAGTNSGNDVYGAFLFNDQDEENDAEQITLQVNIDQAGSYILGASIYTGNQVTKDLTVYVAPVDDAENKTAEQYAVLTVKDSSNNHQLETHYSDTANPISLEESEYLITLLGSANAGDPKTLRYVFIHDLALYQVQTPVSSIVLTKSTETPLAAPATDEPAEDVPAEDEVVEGDVSEGGVSDSEVAEDEIPETITVTATVDPETASKGLTWSSSDTSVATVTADVSGDGSPTLTATVTAVGAGIATITATAADGSEVSGSTDVAVSAKVFNYAFDAVGKLYSNSNEGALPTNNEGHKYLDMTTIFNSYEWCKNEFATISDPWMYVRSTNDYFAVFPTNSPNAPHGAFMFNDPYKSSSLTLKVDLEAGQYLPEFIQYMAKNTETDSDGSKAVDIYLAPASETNNPTREDYHVLSIPAVAFEDGQNRIQSDVCEKLINVVTAGEYYITFVGSELGRYIYAHNFVMHKIYNKPNTSIVATAVSFDPSLKEKTPFVLVEESLNLPLAEIAPYNAAVKDCTWTSSDPKTATVTNGVVIGVKPGIVTITVECNGATDEVKVAVGSAPNHVFAFYDSYKETTDTTYVLKEGDGVPTGKEDVSAPWTLIKKTQNIQYTPGNNANYKGLFLFDMPTTTADEMATLPYVRFQVAVTESGTYTASIDYTEYSASTPFDVYIAPTNATDPVAEHYLVSSASVSLKAKKLSSNTITPSTLFSDTIQLDARDYYITFVQKPRAEYVKGAVDDEKTDRYLVLNKVSLSRVDQFAPIRANGITFKDTSGKTIYNEVLNLTGSIKLNATLSPINATNLTINWSSSDESVATVDQNGKVTLTNGCTMGTAIITATSGDGNVSKSIRVIVGNAPKFIYYFRNDLEPCFNDNANDDGVIDRFDTYHIANSPFFGSTYADSGYSGGKWMIVESLQTTYCRFTHSTKNQDYGIFITDKGVGSGARFMIHVPEDGKYSGVMTVSDWDSSNDFEVIIAPKSARNPEDKLRWTKADFVITGWRNLNYQLDLSEMNMPAGDYYVTIRTTKVNNPSSAGMLISVKDLKLYKTGTLDLFTVEGCQIRVAGKNQFGTDEPQGLRFISTIYKTEFDVDGESLDMAKVKEFGTLLLPSDALKDANGNYDPTLLIIPEPDANGKLKIGGKTVSKVPAKNRYRDYNDRVVFTAVLTNLPEARYNLVVTARAYVIMDDGTVFYGNTTTERSIYQVAKNGWDNHYDSLTMAEKRAFLTIINAVDPEFAALGLKFNSEGKLVKVVGEKEVLVDEKGRLVDEQGRLINENGHLIDEEGNLINENGQRVDEKGNVIEEEDAIKDL